MEYELAVAVAVVVAAVKVVMAFGTDTSFSVLLEVVPAPVIVSRMETVKDWGDKAGLQENTGFVGGLSTSHMVVQA